MGERAVAGVRDRSWHVVNEQLLDHYRAVCPAPAQARTGRPRISVIGTGYLGATHAAGMAELGFEVVGVDQDPDKVAALAEGRLPFHEPDLPELLHRHVTSGRLRFTTSLREAADFADVHFVCVGTPQGPSGAAEMTHVRNAVEALVPLLQRPSLLVGKSTVPVGTAESLVRRIEEIAPPGVDVGLAWNPEFLREGHAVHDTLHPDRIVLGTLDPAGDPAAERTLREVYAAPIAAETPVVVTDLPTAELVKVSANAFLATKISFINAMAELACRGHWRRRDQPSSRRRWATTRGSVGGSSPPASGSVGAACPRTSAPWWRGPTSSSGVPSRWTSSAPSTGSTSGASLPRRRDGGRAGRGPSRARASPCSAPPSSPTPTTSATHPRSTLPAGSRRRAPTSPSTTRPRTSRPERSRPGCGSRPTPPPPVARPTWCCTSPSGPSSATARPGGARSRRTPQGGHRRAQRPRRGEVAGRGLGRPGSRETHLTPRHGSRSGPRGGQPAAMTGSFGSVATHLRSTSTWPMRRSRRSSSSCTGSRT